MTSIASLQFRKSYRNGHKKRKRWCLSALIRYNLHRWNTRKLLRMDTYTLPINEIEGLKPSIMWMEDVKHVALEGNWSKKRSSFLSPKIPHGIHPPHFPLTVSALLISLEPSFALHTYDTKVPWETSASVRKKIAVFPTQHAEQGK